MKKLTSIVTVFIAMTTPSLSHGENPKFGKWTYSADLKNEAMVFSIKSENSEEFAKKSITPYLHIKTGKTLNRYYFYIEFEFDYDSKGGWPSNGISMGEFHSISKISIVSNKSSDTFQIPEGDGETYRFSDYNDKKTVQLAARDENQLDRLLSFFSNDRFVEVHLTYGKYHTKAFRKAKQVDTTLVFKFDTSGFNEMMSHVEGLINSNDKKEADEKKKREEIMSNLSKDGRDSTQFALAQMYQVDGRFRDAFNLYKKLAEKGHVDAMCCLADCYLKGIGTPLDGHEAYLWANIANVYGSERGRGMMLVMNQEGYMYYDRQRSKSIMDKIDKLKQATPIFDK